jgi:hypothetical protein
MRILSIIFFFFLSIFAFVLSWIVFFLALVVAEHFQDEFFKSGNLLVTLFFGIIFFIYFYPISLCICFNIFYEWCETHFFKRHPFISEFLRVLFCIYLCFLPKTLFYSLIILLYIFLFTLFGIYRILNLGNAADFAVIFETPWSILDFYEREFTAITLLFVKRVTPYCVENAENFVFFLLLYIAYLILLAYFLVLVFF